jgi:hypothetical protein
VANLQHISPLTCLISRPKRSGVRLPACYVNTTLHASRIPAASLQSPSLSAGISPNNEGRAFVTVLLWARTCHVGGGWHGYDIPVPRTVATKNRNATPLAYFSMRTEIWHYPVGKAFRSKRVVRIIVPLGSLSRVASFTPLAANKIGTDGPTEGPVHPMRHFLYSRHCNQSILSPAELTRKKQSQLCTIEY